MQAEINGQSCRIASRPCLQFQEVEQADGTFVPGRAHKLPIFIFGEVGTVGRSELIKAWIDKMPWDEPEPALRLDSLTIIVNGESWTFNGCSLRPASGGVILYYRACRHG